MASKTLIEGQTEKMMEINYFLVKLAEQSFRLISVSGF